MTDISAWGHVAAGGAAVAAGIINAVAGGGTLVSFPVLTAVGVPSVRANATNTVALCPGYFGGTYAQRKDLTGLGDGLRSKGISAAIGGLTGSVLLVVTSETAFKQIVPFLILLAVVLMAVQDRLRQWMTTRAHGANNVAELAGVFLAGTYGGYFGAGLGIMLIAVLGLFSDLPFNRLNAVKQLLAFLVNISAAIFLSTSGKVVWSLVLVMAPAALIGGSLGGRLASVLPPKKMRTGVIVLGFVVAMIYFVK